MDLSKYIDIQHNAISEFRNNYPDVWKLVDSAFLISHIISNEIIKSRNNFPNNEFLVLQYWKTTLDYLMESFTLILKKKFDLGLGCLRLSTEIVRNSIRILEKPELATLILQQGNESLKRKSFKFDTTKSDEQYLLNLYNICSTYGIHGHHTSDMMRKPTIISQDHVIVDIAPFEVLKMLAFWLKSFFPLINQYVYYFGKKYKLQSGKIYADMYDSYNIALDSFEKNLNDLTSNKIN